ncbi:hypothetical protein [Vulcanisaeta souniana]|uniref:hypothetical protein n=1 Tax=Vulcanisaeta souniana TaxID=164452 RepID=UPI000AAF3D3E|nr:hypothetical protein [Vulcanisaeta souniana]
MWPGWRIRLLRRLDIVLTVFELVLSIVFLSISYVTGNPYLRGCWCWVSDCLGNECDSACNQGQGPPWN